MPSIRLASCLVLILIALAGCAAPPARAPVSVERLQADALHAEIEVQLLRWEAAGEEIRHGDLQGGIAERNAVVTALREAAGRCAQTDGCELGRFLEAYSAMLAPPAEGSEHAAVGEGAALEYAASSEQSPMLTDIPAAQQSLNLLNGRELRELIALNPQIQAALNEWLTWMRPLLLDSWDNYRHMRHRMWPEYEAAGLPEALLFGILAKESGGRVHAVSRAGAAGPLQFMPATGQRLGLRRRADGFDTRYDPQLATRANVAYLNERFAEFNHDLALALAAYNGGEGRVGRLHRQSGGKPFWHGGIQGALPAETRDYVPMVLAAAWLFLHPEDYGLELPNHVSPPAELLLREPASLNQLAICLGGEGTRNGWFRTLRNLNPQHDPQTVLPANTTLEAPAAVLAAYDAHCLQGPRALLAGDIAAARAAQPTRVASAIAGRYTVRKGDTLAGIARAHRCGSPESLARANNIAAPRYLIKPGQRLSLQGCRG